MVPSFNQSCQLSGPAKRLNIWFGSKLKLLSTNGDMISRQTVPDCPRNQYERSFFTWISWSFWALIQFSLSRNSSDLILVNIFKIVLAKRWRWSRQMNSKLLWASRFARAVIWPELSGAWWKLKMKSFTPMKHRQGVLFRRLVGGLVVSSDGLEGCDTSDSVPVSSSSLSSSSSSSLILFFH